MKMSPMIFLTAEALAAIEAAATELVGVIPATLPAASRTTGEPERVRSFRIPLAEFIGLLLGDAAALDQRVQPLADHLFKLLISQFLLRLVECVLHLLLLQSQDVGNPGN